MKIGVCGGIERIKGAAECGLDYIEPSFKMLALSSEEEYWQFRNELEKYSLACEAANGFLPGEIKITGPSVPYEALTAYLKKGYARAFELGIQTVVLGSGSSRNVPENYPYQEAIQDIMRFVTLYAAPAAAEYGINFVFEPLCKKETNIINTVKEGAMLASAIALENVGVLTDLYHMYREGDTYDDVRELKGLIRHAHISNPLPGRQNMKRCYMASPDEFDYKGYFDALKYAGCERISIEADTRDFAADIPAAAAIMKRYQ